MSNFQRPFFLFIFMLAWGVFSLSQDVAAKVFNPETFTLKNGMQVVVVSNHRAPIVSHMVWYKVGSADELEGKSGLAHFFEHLMFKGTPSYPDGEFSKLVAQNGGQENAFTSSDYTAYYQTVAVDRLELMMRLEADRMTNLALTKEVIEPERLVILEERRQRVDNKPRSLLAEQMSASLFLNHPYRNPVIGWAHEIEKLSLEDLRKFYKKWYAPNNAILVVAGDITAAQLKPLAEKYYGVIPRNPDLQKRNRAEEPPHRVPRRLVLKDARVRQPIWSRTYLAPSLVKSDKATPYALEVLAELLGSGSKSRLYRELTFKKKLTVSAGASYSMGGRDHSRFSLYGSPTPQTSIEQLEAALEAEIASLLKDGLSQIEVDEAKQRLVDSAAFARDSLTAGARVLGAAIASGQTVDDVEAWPSRISLVTKEQVMEAAKMVFKPSHSVTGLLLPEDKQVAK
ncbi:MAG: insulinase family protein [Rhodospirillales bacterium]|nr:insulinase family protein [Rhodospirillales bacterium]